MSYYDEYFDYQVGGARRSGIPHVYIGLSYQRGHGIGSFLGGLFRRVLPLLSRGAKAVGKETLRAGVNMAGDIMDRNVNISEAFENKEFAAQS